MGSPPMMRRTSALLGIPRMQPCRPLYFYSSVCAVPPAYLGYDGSRMHLTSLIDLVLCLNGSSDIMVPSVIDLARAWRFSSAVVLQFYLQIEWMHLASGSKLLTNRRILKRKLIFNLRILIPGNLSFGYQCILFLESTITNSGGYLHALSATGLMLHMIININVLVNVHSKWLNQSIVQLMKQLLLNSFTSDE
ncbi:unnamed protein product [Urochloa humidicola]